MKYSLALIVVALCVAPALGQAFLTTPGSGAVDKKVTLLPSKNSDAGQFFEDDTAQFAGAFRYRGLLGQSESQSITADIVSDTMGPARVTVGTTLAKVDDEMGTMTPAEVEQMETIEQFFASGGSLYVNGEIPIVAGASSSEALGYRFSFAPRVGLNIPELGSSTEEVNGNLHLAVELQGHLSSDNNKIEFFAGARYGRVFGTSMFYEDLGLPSDDFTFGQWVAGLVLKRLVVISVDGDIDSPQLIDDSIETRVTVSFFRSVGG